MSLFSLQRGTSTLKLSDREREQVLQALKQHYAEGRLTIEELERRAERLWRSRTRRDAGRDLSDLPLLGLRQSFGERLRRLGRALLKAHLLVSAIANGSLIGIWALTGEGAFWPAWLLLPSAGLLVLHLLAWRAMRKALRRHAW